jgi:tetratricopeptide (TPR) repeat protein
MGVRFRRSLNIAPGVKLNLTKTGVGVTVGGKYGRYSVHSSGRRTTGFSLPGTGVYYQSTATGGTPHARTVTAASRSRPQPQPARPVDLAHFISKPGLFSGGAEKAYYRGVMAYLTGDMTSALPAFSVAANLDTAAPSAHLFAGMAAIALDQAPQAIEHFEALLLAPHPLPDRLQTKYLPSPPIVLECTVNITEGIHAVVPLDHLSTTLLLAELYQHNGRPEEAIGLIQQLLELVPTNPLVRLSLCDLLFDDRDFDGIVEISTGVANLSDVEVEILDCRGVALMELGHLTAALETFKAALAKTSGRDLRLLNGVRRDRAAAYLQAGQRRLAKADLERVYAADPSFPGVREKLSALAD